VECCRRKKSESAYIDTAVTTTDNMYEDIELHRNTTSDLGNKEVTTQDASYEHLASKTADKAETEHQYQQIKLDLN